MQISRQLRATALLLRRAIENLFRVWVLERDHILPLLLVIHTPEICNARCRFCSQKSLIAANQLVKQVPAEQFYRLSSRLQSIAQSRYYVGGEPTEQRCIEAVLQNDRQMGCWPVAINTNATLLHQRPDVLRYADRIVVSLHAVDAKKAAEIFVISRSMAEQMLSNIREGAIEARRHGNAMVANYVLAEQTLENANDVLDFCLEHDIQLAVVPAIDEKGYWPTIENANSQQWRAYVQFVDRVIAQRAKDPRTIHGSLPYLQRVRNLSPFNCRPSGMLVVRYDGAVLNPCQYKYHGLPDHIGNVFDHGGPLEVLQKALNYQARFNPCDKKCLKACYVEPSLSVEAPLALAMEFLPLAWLRSLT